MKEKFFTPSITGTKMNHAIYYSVQKLKKSLENNELDKYVKSLHDCKINPNFDKIKIKCLLKISIDFGGKEYNQAIIFYQNFDNLTQAFLFKFVFTKQNKLKIIEIPIMPTLLATCKKEDAPPELKREIKSPIKKGKSKISWALIDQLIEKKTLNVVQKGD
jgi:hypothetical protein